MAKQIKKTVINKKKSRTTKTDKKSNKKSTTTKSSTANKKSTTSTSTRLKDVIKKRGSSTGGVVIKPNRNGPDVEPVVSGDTTRVGPITDAVVTRPVGDIIDDIHIPPGLVITPSPLLMMPMRLEYRYIDSGKKVDAIDPRKRAVPKRKRSQRGALSKDISNLPFKTETITKRKLMFRWFPDDGFAEQPLEPMEADEIEAWNLFQETIGAEQAWYDFDNADVAAAWQTFASAVGGVYRAVAIARHNGDLPVEGWEESYGRLFALPEQVTIYAVKDGVQSKIASGSTITEPLRYAPDAIARNQWFTDFTAAKNAGMAVEVSNEKLIDTALNADWIIAVGSNATQGASDLDGFIRNAAMCGRFELLAQDTPTNNSETSSSPFEQTPQDSVTAARSLTWDLRRTGSESETDADILSQALGIEAETLYSAQGAQNTDVQTARDMAYVLLPGLYGTFLNRFGFFTGEVSREELVNFFAEHVIARGPLPAVRFGNNPYGVLPIVRPDGLTLSADSEGASENLFNFVFNAGNAAVEGNSQLADLVPVLKPGSTDVENLLDEILALNPVSKRLDIYNQENTQSSKQMMRCPYVEHEQHDPESYLKAIASKPFAELAVPDANDSTWPLLYRLAHLSRSSYDANPPKLQGPVISRGGRGSRRVIKVVLPSRFKQALNRLATLPADELEIAMMEVLDLHYRSDAWMTGLAYQRLLAQREKGKSALRLGYYSFLGKLEKGTNKGGSDGYIQAPSPSQAVTSALLRSAALRFEDEGAFNINLSSARTRKALATLEYLNAGLTLSEALGYRCERWLHDHDGDALIYTLREKYRFSTSTGSGKIRRRLVNGLAVAEDALSDVKALGKNAQEKRKLSSLHAELSDTLDALSDLTMAEAVHQLANGNGGAANAWVKVMSGSPPPGDLDFLSTRRTGQGSSHRVALVFDKPGAMGSGPRAVAEPALASFAGQQLDGFNNARINVSILRRSASGEVEGEPVWNRELSPAEDLNMSAVDLLVGGTNEMVVRTRWHLLQAWKTDAALQEALGLPPGEQLVASFNKTFALAMDMDLGGASSVNSLEATCTHLRRLLGKARYLESTDMNAASLQPALTEAQQVDDLVFACRALQDRAVQLHSRLTQTQNDLQSYRTTVESSALELARVQETDPSEAELTAARDALSSVRGSLDTTLMTAANFAIPMALRPFGESAPLGDEAEMFFTNVTNVTAAVAAKITTLETVTEETISADSGRQDLTGLRTRLIEALQSSCDGAAIPVFPPMKLNTTTLPTLEQHPDANKAINEWQQIRPTLQPFNRVLQTNDELSVWRSLPDATMVGVEDDPFNRDENELPKSRYFGLYVGNGNGALKTPATGTEICGAVIDEWSELRPSEIQNTALAVNYDAPQNEAPHVLLLAVAEKDGMPSWDDEGLSEVVAEAIRMMQARAQPSTDDSTQGNLFNMVPPTEEGTRRIPTSPMLQRAFDINFNAGINIEFVGSVGSSLTANNMNERSASKKFISKKRR